MKQVYKYDAQGIFIEPVLLYPNEDGSYDIPENTTEKPLPIPNYKPKFINGDWMETIPETELDELKKPPIVYPTEIETLGQQMTEREIEAMEQGQKLTDLELQSMERGQQELEMALRLKNLEEKVG